MIFVMENNIQTFFGGSFLTKSILAFGYHSFKDYFVLHYSKKGNMIYVIFDQFYFHEKVAWCHHKTL
jgi:hypothetical protein